MLCHDVQFFSPVMYGLYHPLVVDDAASQYYSNMDIRSNVGHFLRYDFSAISFFMSDYIKGLYLIGCKNQLYSISSICQKFVCV